MIVTETEVPLVPNSVAWLAQSLGYFDRAGVSVELVKVQQTPSAVAALRSGRRRDGEHQHRCCLATPRDAIRWRLRGVISPDKALPFVIVTKKGIAKPKDLEGKTFGVARVGSVDYETSRIVLKKLASTSIRFSISPSASRRCARSRCSRDRSMPPRSRSASSHRSPIAAASTRS